MGCGASSGLQVIPLKKFGQDRVFDMLKHSIGDFSDFLETCDEDVVIMGHNDVKDCSVFPGLHGDVIYTNAGAWHGLVKERSYIKITPPKHGVKPMDGRVELNYLLSKRDTFHVEN